MPFTSFSEHEVLPDGRRPPVWFALSGPATCLLCKDLGAELDQRPKIEEGEITVDLFGFLTCEPNAEVGAVHPKAIPVILTTRAEHALWTSAPASET